MICILKKKKKKKLELLSIPFDVIQWLAVHKLKNIVARKIKRWEKLEKDFKEKKKSKITYDKITETVSK